MAVVSSITQPQAVVGWMTTVAETGSNHPLLQLYKYEYRMVRPFMVPRCLHMRETNATTGERELIVTDYDTASVSAIDVGTGVVRREIERIAESVHPTSTCYDAKTGSLIVTDSFNFFRVYAGAVGSSHFITELKSDLTLWQLMPPELWRIVSYYSAAGTTRLSPARSLYPSIDRFVPTRHPDPVTRFVSVRITSVIVSSDGGTLFCCCPATATGWTNYAEFVSFDLKKMDAYAGSRDAESDKTAGEQQFQSKGGLYSYGNDPRLAPKTGPEIDAESRDTSRLVESVGMLEYVCATGQTGDRVIARAPVLYIDAKANDWRSLSRAASAAPAKASGELRSPVKNPAVCAFDPRHANDRIIWLIGNAEMVQWNLRAGTILQRLTLSNCTDPIAFAMTTTGAALVLTRFNNQLMHIDTKTGACTRVAGRGPFTNYSGYTRSSGRYDGPPLYAELHGATALVVDERLCCAFVTECEYARVRRVELDANWCAPLAATAAKVPGRVMY